MAPGLETQSSLRKMHLRVGQYESYSMIRTGNVTEQAQLRYTFQAAFGPLMKQGLAFSYEFVDFARIMKESSREGDVLTRYAADFGHTLKWADDC